MDKNRWSRISLLAFMREMAGNTESGGRCGSEVTLTVAARAVESGRWYTLTWIGEDGGCHIAEASRIDLLAERATEIELGVESKGDG